MKLEASEIQQLLENLYEPRKLNKFLRHLFKSSGIKKWVFCRVEGGLLPVWGNLPLTDEEKARYLRISLALRSGKRTAVPVKERGQVRAVLVVEGHHPVRKLKSLARLLFHIHRAVGRYEYTLKEAEVFRVIRELSSSLTLSFDWKETLRRIVDAIKKILKARTVALYILDKEKKTLTALYGVGYRRDAKAYLHLKYGKGLVGWAAKTGEAIVVPDVRKEERYYKVREKTLSELVVPIKFNNEVIGVINVEDDRLNYFSDKEKRLLEVFASYAAVVIERARVYQEMIAQERTLKELEVARKIQFQFLPQKDPVVKDFYVSGKEIPAFKVGGDYFDFFWVGRRKLAVVIADVVGKGVPAALMMASFRSAVRLLLEENELEVAVSRLNEFVYQSTSSNQFITSIVGVLDLDRRKFFFANAGHNYPVVIKAGKAQVLEKSNLVLGVRKNVKYEILEVDFNQWDCLFLYTDGIVEQTNREGEEFGMERFVSLLEKHCSSPPAKVIKAVIEELRNFCQCENFDDDVTIIGLKRKDEVGS